MQQQTISSWVLAACVLALTGCAAPTPSPSGTPPPALAADHSLNFPDMDQAWLKGGSFIDVEQLRRIHTGMTKNQVRELISYPHFSEGLFGPRAWNYIFNFRTGRGQEYITCQYMVHYDQDVRSQDFHWKGPDCEAMLNPPVAAREETLQSGRSRSPKIPPSRARRPAAASPSPVPTRRYAGGRPYARRLTQS